MSINISRGLGSTLAIGATGIGSIKKIGGITLKREMIDITTLAASGGYKSFIPGLVDGGSVAIEGFMDTGDAGQNLLLTKLGTQFTNQAADAFTITFPTITGAAWTFNGFIESLDMSGDADDKNAIPFKMSVKVTGQPTFATSATADLSAIGLSSGTVAPTFVGTQYVYVAEIAGTAEIVTPVGSAGQTYDYYADGTFIGTYSQGSASASTAFAIIGVTHTFTIIVKQSGYSPKTYTVTVVKTS